MTIRKKIFEYLEKNFDGRLLIIVDNVPHLCNDNETACEIMVKQFEFWAKENVEEKYQDPICLFDYCLETHSFGAICDLYYEDNSGDFCFEKPYAL